MSKQAVPRHGRKAVIDSTDNNQIKMAEAGENDRKFDLQFVMSQPRGRRFMFDLINETCHVRRLSHVPGDPHTSAFNEGGRAIGEALLQQIIAEQFSLYLKMLDENEIRET